MAKPRLWIMTIADSFRDEGYYWLLFTTVSKAKAWLQRKYGDSKWEYKSGGGYETRVDGRYVDLIRAKVED